MMRRSAMSGDAIAFVPLGDIAPDVVISHMSDPRMGVHMPLLTGAWGDDDYVRFRAAKDACWQRDGLGHWALVPVLLVRWTTTGKRFLNIGLRPRKTVETYFSDSCFGS